MPELPDLVRVERVLSSALAGRRVVAARTGDPTVLRVMVPDAFPADLAGRVLHSVARRGHFMRFAFDPDRLLIVNAMLAGRYQLLPAADAAAKKDGAALGLALTFEDGTELRYVDDKRMGKVYVTRDTGEASIPVYGQLGIDVLSPAFDRARFAAIARGRRDQVRMFLMDKRALASIGNAYADEILFEARIHPKTFVRQLSADDLERLHAAIGRVLRAAIDEIERRGEPVETKVRDFLVVRGRDGKPCTRCGTKIRAVRVGDGDACFCPTCQPAARRLFVDWGRLPQAPESRSGAVSPAAADRTLVHVKAPRRRTRKRPAGV
ncbi:MAG: DNA-formamidopyrimidine glycosylase family protein [Verrucomicrobiota bacterium]